MLTVATCKLFEILVDVILFYDEKGSFKSYYFGIRSLLSRDLLEFAALNLFFFFNNIYYKQKDSAILDFPLFVSNFC